MVVIYFAERQCSAEVSVHVDGNAIVMFAVDETMIEQFIKDNSLAPLKDWPNYGNTGLPPYRVPTPIQQRAKAEPNWSGRDLLNYATITETPPPHVDRPTERHINRYFYHARSQTLVLLHDEQRFLERP
jgi:hypothetical protein